MGAESSIKVNPTKALSREPKYASRTSGDTGGGGGKKEGRGYKVRVNGGKGKDIKRGKDAAQFVTVCGCTALSLSLFLFFSLSLFLSLLAVLSLTYRQHGGEL
jgi:hypothetical protein